MPTSRRRIASRAAIALGQGLVGQAPRTAVACW